MKFKVELARLVRETRVVVVEATTQEELQERLSEVYDLDDDLGEWKDDVEWGCDEGTHTIIGTDNSEGECHLITLPKEES